MTNVAILGDYHGPQGVPAGDTFAEEMGCSRILQCGDFYAYGVVSGFPTHWVRGNHEDWSIVGRIRNDQYGGPSMIHFQDDYTTLEIDNTVFGFVGGIQPTAWHKDHLGMLGGVKSWKHTGWGKTPKELEDRIWVRPPEEHEMQQLVFCDVLVFHDRPWMTHQQGDGYANLLSDIVRTVRPDLVVHGHMHGHNVREERLDGKVVDIVELPPCDNMGWTDGFADQFTKDVIGVVYDAITGKWEVERMDEDKLPQPPPDGFHIT